MFKYSPIPMPNFCGIGGISDTSIGVGTTLFFKGIKVTKLQYCDNPNEKKIDICMYIRGGTIRGKKSNRTVLHTRFGTH